jgi:Arc/MetJ-type ribon-helix-helix transcriptional regulator
MASQALVVTLPDEVRADVEAAVASGEYASPESLLQDVMQSWSAQQHALALYTPEATAYIRKKLAEAEADPMPGRDAFEVLDELESKYRALAADQEESIAL